MTGEKHVMFEMKKKTTTPKSKEMFKLYQVCQNYCRPKKKNNSHLFKLHKKTHGPIDPYFF